MEFDIKSVSLENNFYPASLKKIKNPPKKLYFMGNLLEEDELCLGIVGSRNPTDYGKKACLEIGDEIARSNTVIVSGLAKGIDSIAHNCAINNKSRTIAVLGSGIDYQSFYPKENWQLAKKIIANNGLIISEYDQGVKPSRFSFPQRNRLIAGLSSAILVIEAKEKSGSLITAEQGKNQGKKIFAIPNSIYSQNSKGCLNLIKNGAKLTDCAKDIFDEFKKNDLPLIYQENKKIFTTNDEKENNIINLLLQSEQPLNIETIIRLSNLPSAKAISTITILEIKNIIIDIGDKNYCLNKNYE